MAISRRLPRLRLNAVDELIAVRKLQHGGGRGAPPIVRGERVGAAINKSCILMLSALLQGYVESVFVEASRRTLKNLRSSDEISSYRRSFKRWGNPNGENTTRLFARIGIINVFENIKLFNGRIDERTLRARLQEINTLRNRIAHGQELPRRVSLAEVEKLRTFASEFGTCFAQHVMKKL